MSKPTFDRDQMIDLLIDRATVGIDDDQSQSLKSQLAELGLNDDWSFDQTAAVIEETLVGVEMPQLPSHVKNQVLSDANQFVLHGASRVAEDLRDADADVADSQPRQRIVDRRESLDRQEFLTLRTQSIQAREAMAWLAAAAAIVLAAFVWLSRPQTDAVTAETQPLIAQTTEANFEKFVQDHPENFEVVMAAGEDVNGANAAGTVYWDRDTKRGFVKISGLKVNDPQLEQYQLWVIDKVRGIEDRPNAGVFNVASDGNVYFEFRSDLQVFDAQGFAITVEKPGGVNKSDLSRVALANLGV